MNLPSFKRIIIIVLLAICFYIIYRLVAWRQTIMAVSPGDVDTALLDSTQKEGFFAKKKNETMATISKAKNLSLPLKEYFIYSSWNSCWDKADLTLNQLENIMNHGCRFLDFEIYNIDGKPEIGYSTMGYTPGGKAPELESDTIGMLDLCNKIMEMRTAGTVPNTSDPLFLHFRIKADQQPILEKMATAILGSGIGDPNILATNITHDTVLSDLENKIVIVIDKGYVPDIQENACPANCESDLRKLVGLYSNDGGNFTSTKWEYQKGSKSVDPLDLRKNSKSRTNVDKLKMVTHNLGSEYIPENSDDFNEFVMKYKVQIVPYKFYYPNSIDPVKETNPLTEYKNIFSDNGHTAFIPLSVLYSKYSQQ